MQVKTPAATEEAFNPREAWTAPGRVLRLTAAQPRFSIRDKHQRRNAARRLRPRPGRLCFAIFGVARFAAFQAITQKPAFDQHGRIFRQPQDTEICRVHAPISRMGDRH